jgi:hypothetical protein
MRRQVSVNQVPCVVSADGTSMQMLGRQQRDGQQGEDGGERCDPLAVLAH